MQLAFKPCGQRPELNMHLQACGQQAYAYSLHTGLMLVHKTSTPCSGQLLMQHHNQLRAAAQEAKMAGSSMKHHEASHGECGQRPPLAECGQP
ncbi:hypothetical protein Dimus_018478 [Dionaea muscipula]